MMKNQEVMTSFSPLLRDVWMKDVATGIWSELEDAGEQNEGKTHYQIMKGMMMASRSGDSDFLQTLSLLSIIFPLEFSLLAIPFPLIFSFKESRPEQTDWKEGEAIRSQSGNLHQLFQCFPHHLPSTLILPALIVSPSFRAAESDSPNTNQRNTAIH